MRVPDEILHDMQDVPRSSKRNAWLLLIGVPVFLIVICLAGVGAVFSEEVSTTAQDLYYWAFPPIIPDGCPGCGAG